MGNEKFGWEFDDDYIDNDDKNEDEQELTKKPKATKVQKRKSRPKNSESQDLESEDSKSKSKKAKKTKVKAKKQKQKQKRKKRRQNSANETRRRAYVEQKLRDVIHQANGAKEGAVRREAELMYSLAGEFKELSPLNNETIFGQHPSVFCSYADPRQSLDITPCERPVSPIACGAKGEHYGPELMFSHVFPGLDTKYKGMPIGITKVSPSGSRIDEYIKNSGSEKNWWASLEKNIHMDHGTIEAFFWYQGENNMFPEMDQREYLDKLTKLVDDVRREIFVAHRRRWGVGGSPTAKFES